MRVAAYYAPARDDPLCDAGNAWLGRDPETAVPVSQPALPGIEAVTAEARRYGFHATLKPPMQLRPGTSWPVLRRRAEAIARRLAPFDLPPLEIADLHGFLALRESAPCPPLQALADACVEGLDGVRALPSAEEMARRRKAGLTPEQEAMLTRWGYPYVFGTWFFHITLTRQLGADEKPGWLQSAEQHFAGLLAHPRRVREFCLFTQAEPNAPFLVAERFALRG